MTQRPGLPAEPTGTPPVYTLRRTVHGYIAAIERDGYTVLQLQDGSVRNEEEAAAIVDRLNFAPSDEQVDRLINAIWRLTLDGIVPVEKLRRVIREWTAKL